MAPDKATKRIAFAFVSLKSFGHTRGLSHYAESKLSSTRELVGYQTRQIYANFHSQLIAHR